MHLDPVENQILQTLPTSTLAHWMRFGEIQALAAEQVLSHPGQTMRWTYFPLTAVLAWTHVLQSGASMAIALIGHEGAAGLNHPPMRHNHLLVHAAGHALRVPTPLVHETAAQLPATQAASQQFLGSLLSQMSQTAVCNRHHKLEQQLIRLLLSTWDRCRDAQLHMTHEHMASMLGARREGVSMVAALLQQAGLIRYARGRITLLDRAALAERACECYALISDTALGGASPGRITPAPFGSGWRSGSGRPLCAVPLCA